MKVKKMIQRDKELVIQNAVQALYPLIEGLIVFSLDEESGEAYLESSVGGYTRYKISYHVGSDFTGAIITSELVEIPWEQKEEFPDIEETVVEPVNNLKDESFIKRVVKGVLDALSPIDNVIRIPQLDESNEQMIEISQMYCSPLVEDAHGEAMTAEDILAMVESFNEVLGRGGIQMKVDHEDAIEGVYPVKAFIAEFDMELLTPEGVVRIPEGTPLVKLQYTDPVLWAERKSGVFTGISIGAASKYEEDAILEWE